MSIEAENTTDRELESLRRQLKTYKYNLAFLEEKKARYGLDIPLELHNEINYVEDAIKNIEEQIRELEAGLQDIKATKPSKDDTPTIISEPSSRISDTSSRSFDWKWFLQYIVVPIVVAIIGAGGIGWLVSRSGSNGSTPTSTAVAETISELQTNTLTPTSTKIATPTDTPIPSFTPTPTNMPLPTFTPTSILENTATPTNTPLPTNTPTATSPPSNPDTGIRPVGAFNIVWELTGAGQGPLGYPVSNAQTVGYAPQNYGNGFGLFVEIQPHTIFFAVGSGNQGSVSYMFPDMWAEGMPEYSCAQTLARRGFGKAICDNFDKLAVLGQPTNEEVGGLATVQTFQNGIMVNGDRDPSKTLVFLYKGGWMIY